MENQKIRVLTQIIALSFLFCGITTMNYAQNFQIKHIYEPIVNTLGHHMSTASFPIAISGDSDVITSGLAGSSIIDSNEFGIYKTPLTADAKKRVDEINQLLRMPYIEKI